MTILSARLRTVVFAPIACAYLIPAPVAAQIVASTASDVCPAGANPCVVNQVVTIVSGSDLDFGARTLRVTGNGRLDFGSGVAAVRCGRLEVAVGEAIAIAARGTGSVSVGGVATIQARRTCSTNAGRLCLADRECQQAGFGTCSGGNGGIELDGRVVGDAESPGEFFITAAGHFNAYRTISSSAVGIDGDGGAVELTSVAGNLDLRAPVAVRSGGFGTGGDITLVAGGTVRARATLDAAGGDFDGGVIDITAGGSVTVEAELLAGAAGGAGSGGEILIASAADMTFSGGTSLSAARVEVTGAGPLDGIGGDGGELALDAGGSVHIGGLVRIDASGSRPDGSGGAIEISADDTLTLNGTVRGRARGRDGSGADAFLEAGATVFAAAASVIDVEGGTDGGGQIEIAAGADLILLGAMNVNATGGGPAGDIDLTSDAAAVLSGPSTLQGGLGFSASRFTLEACTVQVAGATSITNSAPGGENRFIVHESMMANVGSSIRATGVGGSNKIDYRDASDPPALRGTISPQPALTHVPGLTPCPVCGNAEVESGETCDDGNTTGGDGCSAACQDEGCVAGTPGYPTVPLCSDGNGCTVDTCDTVAHICKHVESCDDGVACTADVCADGACKHTVSHAACHDSNPCTDDVCVVPTGCRNTANQAACDDGVSCTFGDSCSGGSCSGTPACPQGEVCNLNSGTCTATTTTTLPAIYCGDGDVDPGEECDRGAANGSRGRACSASCTYHACGDPNGSGTVTASDALFILNAAVDIEVCDLCLCDVTPSPGVRKITATDALTALRRSVGLPVVFACPPCA